MAILIFKDTRHATESWNSPRVLLRHVADEADVIVDADDVALRAAAVRELRGIAGLGIAALGTGAVDVNIVVITGIWRRAMPGGPPGRGPPATAGLAGTETAAPVRWPARHAHAATSSPPRGRKRHTSRPRRP